MTLHAKRIWILFSVALNIGFVITAIVLFYTNPPPMTHPHYHAYARKALAQLDLAPEQEKAVLENMDRFRDLRNNVDRDFHKVRSRMLSLLSLPGPLDHVQFDAIGKQVAQLETRKHECIRQHILDMRNRLGDEKGAEFFAAILAQVQTNNKERP